MASHNEGGTKNAGLSVLLGCTPACQHPQLLACWHVGMLVDGQPAREEGEECWHVCAVDMHPSMPASPVAGMLACWDANQQHRQTSMTTTEALAEVAWPWLWMLVCTPAPSTQHPAILGYNRGCWPCGHVSMAAGWLRLLVFSSFCSGKGAAEKRNSYIIYATFCS